MLKAKKILSVLLSFIMLFGTFSLVASAENSLVSEISLNVDIEAGMTRTDYNDFVTILSDNIEFSEDFSNPVSVYSYDENVYFDDDDTFADDITYDVVVYLEVAEGFEIDENIQYVTVNGKRSGVFYYEDTNEDGVIDYIAVCLYEIKVNEEPFSGEYIQKAEVEIETDIKGIRAKDYESYINILTSSLEFEDNYGDPAVYVYDSNYNEFTGKFRSGETYYISLYLCAKSGSALDGYVDCFVNGEEVYSYVDCWYPNDDVKVEYVCLDTEITVDGEKEFSFFYSIADFFRNLIETIINFFKYGPIVPLAY